MPSQPEPQIDVLIMAAHALELSALRAGLAAEFRAVFRGTTIGMSEVGVGAMLAGGGAARALLEMQPRVAILLGSCGVYPGRATFAPGQLMLPARVVALDSAVLDGRAAFPAPMPVAIEPDPGLLAALSRALQPSGEARDLEPIEATLATTLAITTDDALATRLGTAGDCVAENLEALAVALACRAHGVPFAALLGVTNEVGARGRAQWREHHALVARNTADGVLRWLTAGDR